MDIVPAITRGPASAVVRSGKSFLSCLKKSLIFEQLAANKVKKITGTKYISSLFVFIAEYSNVIPISF